MRPSARLCCKWYPEHESWLHALARAQRPVQVVVEVALESALGFNVETKVAGSQPRLSPLVVMTPKSSWWQSTAERGGGIAVWLAFAAPFRHQSATP